MKKNSIGYLEGLVKRGVRVKMPALRDFRYRDRGIEHIVKKIVPTDHDTLMKISKQASWLIMNAPEEYVYGEMIDVDNAVASNLKMYLTKYANSYLNRMSQ